MIDFYLEIGISGTFPKDYPWNRLHQYSNYLRLTDSFSWPGISFYTNCLDDQHQDFQFVVSENYVYVLLGEFKLKNKYVGEISQKWSKIFDDHSLYDRYKGNYIIVRINKQDHVTEMISSPLCVIPCNYCVIDGVIRISSSVTLLMKALQTVDVDQSSLLQLSMFDTFLDNNTLIEKVKQVQYGEYIKLSRNKVISRTKHYDHIQQIPSNPLSRKEGLPAIKEALETYWGNFPWDDKFIFGLTGGFDCRLNLAYVPSKGFPNMASYTFGMKGNNEMKVSDQIAMHYNLNHTDIYLDANYEEMYHEIASETLRLGDGFTPFMRCNYLYAHRIMADKGINCVTGMYGSELIRPMFFIPDPASITHEAERAFLAGSPMDGLQAFADSIRTSSNRYYQDKVYSKANIDAALEPIERLYCQDKQYGVDANLFNFYLNEGMRKFFMEIMRLDRYYIHHYLPYLDLDFFEALMASRYAGVYNHMFGNLFQRRKGQLLYVDILKDINQYLFNLKTDRGFKPSDHRNLMGLGRLSLGYIWQKKIKRYLKGNTTFNTIKWRAGVYDKEHELLQKSSHFFNETMVDKFTSNYYKKHEHEYARHFSVKKWLSDNGLDN